MYGYYVRYGNCLGKMALLIMLDLSWLQMIGLLNLATQRLSLTSVWLFVCVCYQKVKNTRALIDIQK